MDHRQVADDVTVVVPTLGRPVLAECLDHLRRGTVLPHQVVVVHQGSDPGVAELCAEADRRGLPCRYVPCPEERGAARARNRGIALTGTRFVAAIDDDCLADERWLELLVAALHEEPHGVVTGQILAGGAGVPSVITAPEARVYRAPTSDRDILYTGSMAAPTALFAEVGPFSQAAALLPAAEDNEWAYRVLSAGVPIRYEPRVRATHLDWRSGAELEDVERRYARGQGGFYGLYLRRGDRFVARRAARDLARAVKALVVALGQRDRRAGRVAALRLVELVRGVLSGLFEPRASRPGSGR